MANYRTQRKIQRLKRRHRLKRYFLVPSWKVFLKGKQDIKKICQALASLKMDDLVKPNTSNTTQWVDSGLPCGVDSAEYFIGGRHE